jgi:hypothetical protein
MMRRSILAAALLIVAAGREARGDDAAPAAAAGEEAADVNKLIEAGDRAQARRDWDEAARNYQSAALHAPDARLRDKLWRALDRRARIREARAAHPPPVPASIAGGGSRASAEIRAMERRLWRMQLKREALEARADATANNPAIDFIKAGQMRDAAKKLQAEEDLLSDELERKKRDPTGKLETKSMFDGAPGVDEDMKHGILH